MKLSLLTETRTQTARRCLREEDLRYVQGLETRKTAEGMRFGTLGHHAEEAWWSREVTRHCDRLAFARAAIRAHVTTESDAFEVAKLEALIEGYDARWGKEHYEVIGVELEFRAPLVNPETGARSRTFERAGKLDVLVRDAQGRKFIVEHKFSGEDIGAGSTFWARLKIGGQSAGYIRGAQALGHEVDGVIYDVLARPRLEPYKATPDELREYTKRKFKLCPECKKKNAAPLPHLYDLDGGQYTCEDDPEGGTRRVVCTDRGGRLYASQRDLDETVDEFRDRVRKHIGENPDKYYQRGLVVRLEEQMVEHDRELWLLASTLREHHRLQLAPRNTDACHRYGSMCSYFPLCTNEASVDDYARRAWPHPELKQEA